MRISRGIGIAAIAVMMVVGNAVVAQAYSPTAATTGAMMGTSFYFVNSAIFRSPSIDVCDTACDARSVRGNDQSMDAYGDVFTYANHDNNTGRGTGVRWSDLTGSNAFGVRYVRARAHKNNFSDYGFTSWYRNSYW
jgi:hypothetical protein